MSRYVFFIRKFTWSKNPVQLLILSGGKVVKMPAVAFAPLVALTVPVYAVI